MANENLPHLRVPSYGQAPIHDIINDTLLCSYTKALIVYWDDPPTGWLKSCTDPGSNLAWTLGNLMEELAGRLKSLRRIGTPQGLQSFQQIFHTSPQSPCNVWFWISAAFSVSLWVDPLNRQLIKASVWEHNRVSLIMSWISACP